MTARQDRRANPTESFTIGGATNRLDTLQPLGKAAAGRCCSLLVAYIVPRLLAAGADVSRVHVVRLTNDECEACMTLPDDVPSLVEFVKGVDAACPSSTR